MHGYEPFWKLTPTLNVQPGFASYPPEFTIGEDLLLTALWDAHQAVAMRGNASGEAFTTAYAGSGDYTKALAGALATLGARHGPIVETCHVLKRLMLKNPVVRIMPEDLAVFIMPGWGNALVKGSDDPAFLRVRDHLENLNQKLVERIDAITGALHARGKHIYPNPSCWTAAVAITVGLPAELSPYLFIAARLPVWSRAVMEQR